MIMLIKDINLPLYLQVKNYIETKISEKEFLPGQKLPTERALAKQLAVSRNTVSEAYKELALEGILVCKTGRGTFLAGENAPISAGKTRMDRLGNVIAAALDRSLKMGFTTQDFMSLTQIKIREIELINSRKRILVLDQMSDLAYAYSKQLEQFLGCLVEYNTLEGLNNMSENLLKNYTNIIVPRNIFKEFKTQYPRIANKNNVKIVDCQLNLKDILAIAKIDIDKSIMVVAEDNNFQRLVEEVFTSIGINSRLIAFQNINTLNNINNYDVYVTSSRLEEQAHRKLQGKRVIVLNKEIDQGSLQKIVNNF